LAQVIVPRNPGAFSALGVLLSDIVKDVSHTVLLAVPEQESNFVEEIARQFRPLERAARAELRAEGFAGTPAVERRLDLRYVGQSYELTVPFEPGFRRTFEREHARAYGHAEPRRPIELVALRLRLLIKTAVVKDSRRAPRRPSSQPKANAVFKRKPVWFNPQPVETTLYDRERLVPGTQFRGPAVVMEYSSTTVVPPDYACRVDGDGNLILARWT